MSENMINAALRRLGYGKEQITGHGFCSIASTLLNEQGWHRDAIERQLAHAERNNVRAADLHTVRQSAARSRAEAQTLRATAWSAFESALFEPGKDNSA